MSEANEIAEGLRRRWESYSRYQKHNGRNIDIDMTRRFVRNCFMGQESQTVIDNVAQALFDGSAK